MLEYQRRDPVAVFVKYAKFIEHPQVTPAGVPGTVEEVKKERTCVFASVRGLGALTRAKRFLRLMFRATGVMNRGARTTRRKGNNTMNKNASTTMQTAAVAEQGAHIAPEHTTPTKQATTTKGAPRGKKVARKGKETPVAKATVAARVNPPASRKNHKNAVKRAARTSPQKATGTARVPREFSKKAIVLDLLRRNDGATITEIAKATDWQNHSIRGFISGTVGKRLGLAVESATNAAGERTYRIACK